MVDCGGTASGWWETGESIGGVGGIGGGGKVAESEQKNNGARVEESRSGVLENEDRLAGWLASCWMAAGWLAGRLANKIRATDNQQQDSCHRIPTIRFVPHNTNHKIRATEYQQYCYSPERSNRGPIGG